jgi:hypothetical protein
MIEEHIRIRSRASRIQRIYVVRAFLRRMKFINLRVGL